MTMPRRTHHVAVSHASVSARSDLHHVAVTRVVRVLPLQVDLGDEVLMTRSHPAREPVVSVIIPAYNASADIPDALASVFAQTFTSFEVIVVNDGSSDTAELEAALEPYRGRIRYVAQPNRGAGAARNTGIRAAS